MTTRTPAQIKAFERDGPSCLWCRVKCDLLRSGNHVHHILRRKPGTDVPEACVHLCWICHEHTHNARSPSKAELVELMREVYGYDLQQTFPEYV